MVARIPLIVNPSAEQIQELPNGDTLVATASTATKVTFSTESGSSTWHNLVFTATSAAGDGTLLVDSDPEIQYQPSTMGLRLDGDITAFYSSDERLKDNITVIPNALDKVKSISGNTFTWNDKCREGSRGLDDTGVIAQEVEKLGLPGITQTRDLSEAEGYDPSLGNELKAVDYKRLVPLLIEAIKELSAKVDALS